MKGNETTGEKRKEAEMIKGIIGYKMLNYKEVEPIFIQLRLHAMQSQGFISA